MKTWRVVVFVATIGVIAAPAVAVNASTAVSASGSPTRLAGLAPRVPVGATRLGPLPPAQQLAIDVVLRPSHPDQLAVLLHDLYDPTSARYQQWLTPHEFSDEFGPSRAEVARVTAWLHTRGLRNTGLDGMAVHANGSAQTVARAFGIAFSRYRLSGDSTGYLPSAAPVVPQALSDDIATVLGISDTVRFNQALDRTPRTTLTPHPARRLISHAAGTACAQATDFADGSFWTPDQIGRSYHVNGLFAAGLTGKATTIALFELARSRANDTSGYFSCFGLHNHVTVNPIDGGATPSLDGSLETEIDIQEAATQAPGASILSYEAPNSAVGAYDAYNQIVQDNRAQVVSTSWGICEAELTGPNDNLDALHTVFQQAAAQGQTIFAASGDAGSEDCYHGFRFGPSETLQVDNPADDPFVTGVGGTALEEPVAEPVWNDCEGERNDACASNGAGAGGGGQSRDFKRPDWQPLATGATCTTCREVPDLSANAGVGETFYFQGSWTAIGGTSIAAPKLAGITADIDQGCDTARIGDVAPKLAALVAAHADNTAVVGVTTGVNWTTFTLETPGSNDLTRTNAGMFKTAPGFNLATGFGVPNAPGLACPQVTAITPKTGPPGAHVTLHGIGLEHATITFDTTPADVLAATPTSAIVVAPPGTGTATITATDPIGTGNHPTTFTYSNNLHE